MRYQLESCMCSFVPSTPKRKEKRRCAVTARYLVRVPHTALQIPYQPDPNLRGYVGGFSLGPHVYFTPNFNGVFFGKVRETGSSSSSEQPYHPNALNGTRRSGRHLLYGVLRKQEIRRLSSRISAPGKRNARKTRIPLPVY